jgi:CheY-like chemotaxis protein
VEDDPLVRRTTVEALRSLGYTPLEADGPSTALALLKREPRVDLLLTDVVMPEMSGRELARLALEQRQTIKVLYMTGYTPNAIVHNGVLDPGVSLLVKPFTIEQLRSKLPALLRAAR